MNVLITEPAKESLKEICKHYRSLELDTYAINQEVRKTAAIDSKVLKKSLCPP